MSRSHRSTKAIKRRLARGHKPTVRRFCNSSGNQWLALSGDAPAELKELAAKLGTPKYTQAEQDANPDLPYTRIVKDVLPVGRKLLGYREDGSPDYWDVTPRTLSLIAEQYDRGRRLGYQANLGKTHGDDNGLIHPDDLVAPIDRVVVVGNCLWLSSYVTPEQARYLSNPARKVSIGTMEPFTDGSGNVYPIQLIHTAITDQPVVTGQRPFMKLALGPGVSSMENFDALLAAINELLTKAGGSALPDDTTAENLADRVIGAVSGMGGTTEVEDDTETETTETETTDTGTLEDSGDMGAFMSLKPGQQPTDAQMKALGGIINPLVAPLVESVKTLTAEVKSLKADKAGEAKARFLSHLTDMGNAGLPAARVEHFKKLGEKYGHDMALLDGVDKEPGVDMRRLSKKLASGETPTVPGAGRLSDEEMAKRLEQRGIKPAWNPKQRTAAG